MASLALWFVVIMLFYLIGRILFGLVGGEISGGSLLVLVVGAIVLAQPVARWGEKQLVARWTSGRSVRLESGAITLREKSGALRIDLRQKVNYWRWWFVIRGRRGGAPGPERRRLQRVRLPPAQSRRGVRRALPLLRTARVK
jgi:hypothetical protein